MLIATITALLLVFGGGASATLTVLDLIDRTDDVIEDRVEDEALREEMLAINGRMKAQTEAFLGRIQTHRKEFGALDLNPDSTREQYLDSFRRLDKAWVQVEHDLVDGILALKGKVSEEEWQEMRKYVVGEID